MSAITRTDQGAPALSEAEMMKVLQSSLYPCAAPSGGASRWISPAPNSICSNCWPAALAAFAEEELAPLFRHCPAGMLDMPEGEDLQDLLDEARYLCLDMLEGK